MIFNKAMLTFLGHGYRDALLMILYLVENQYALNGPTDFLNRIYVTGIIKQSMKYIGQF